MELVLVFLFFSCPRAHLECGIYLGGNACPILCMSQVRFEVRVTPRYLVLFTVSRVRPWIWYWCSCFSPAPRHTENVAFIWVKMHVPSCCRYCHFVEILLEHELVLISGGGVMAVAYKWCYGKQSLSSIIGRRSLSCCFFENSTSLNKRYRCLCRVPRVLMSISA